MSRFHLFLLSSLALAGPAAYAAPARHAAPLRHAAPAPAKAITRPTEAEALKFVRAFSPSELRREAEIHVLRKNFVKTLRTDPPTAAMLDAYPTLGQELTAAMESQVDIYIEEYDAQFFPRASAIVRQGLSREDVQKLTVFYESPLGQKMLRTIADNADGSEVAQLGLKGEQVDSGVINRQIFRSGLATAQALTTQERDQVVALSRSPAGQHFKTLRSQMVALQAELMNHPGERFQEASKKALAEVMQRVTATDSQAH